MRSVIFALLFACGAKEGDTASSGDSAEADNGSNCPNSVPEEYRFTWNCLNTDCAGATVYRYAQGQSDQNGNIQVEEKWFVFDGIQPCVDTFQISGLASDINTDQFGCTTCERIFEVSWDLQDAQCGWNWKSTFADQESDEQSYYGFLMMDTHHRVSFDEGAPLERYEDNVIHLVGAPVNLAEGVYDPIPNYATGVAIPNTSNDEIGAPEDYTWVSEGSCYQ